MPGIGSTYENTPVIVVADDHRMTRHMIRSILEQEGFQVLEAENGREALEKFTAHRTDLVISDIIMPVMDGLELCARLKQLPEGKHVPVLIFTALHLGREVDESFQAGASDFINKPLNPDELKHRVRRLLYLRNLEMKREAAEEELHSSYDKIRSLSRKVQQAYEEERARLARELHDELGMTLTTLKLNAQLLNKDLSGLSGNDQQKALGRLSSVLELVDSALAVTRSKARLMRPPSLDDLGLVTVIENMLTELRRHSDIKTKLSTSEIHERLPIEVETALYRCVQEAITNVARHSSAGKVSIDLVFKPQEVSAIIKDDGVGFEQPHDSTEHLGLQGMKERVDLLSGEFKLKSYPGRGTEIMIKIPLNEQQGEQSV